MRLIPPQPTPRCGTRAYHVWEQMRQRCRNPRHRKYPDYGARGITICARWESFDRFLADMGPPPKGLSLDRIDNDGNYEPSNCRWASRMEQQKNTRWNKFIEVNGERLHVSEACRRFNLKTNTLWYRMTRWPKDRWLEPARPTGRQTQ